jgi:hypothetical protein
VGANAEWLSDPTTTAAQQCGVFVMMRDPQQSGTSGLALKHDETRRDVRSRPQDMTVELGTPDAVVPSPAGL